MTISALPEANSSRAQGAAETAGSRETSAEFQALISGCGIYHLSGRTKISVTGGDRVRWLNGMISNNVRDLAPGRGIYAYVLNAQGRIQADLYAYQRGDSLLIDTESEQRDKLLQIFDRYIIADDVEIADISGQLRAIGLGGPEARSVLRKAGIDVPKLARLEFAAAKCDCDCGCVQCTLVGGDDSEGPAYEIWLAPDKLKATFDALVAEGATAVGSEALELRRISFGIPRYGVDIRERDLPQETGQDRALSFTKGCYLGQEIVERIRSRGAVHRQFSAFVGEGVLPEVGSKILADGNEAGEITSNAILPLASGDLSVGLGYLRREATGKELRAGGATLKLASLPMV